MPLITWKPPTVEVPPFGKIENPNGTALVERTPKGWKFTTPAAPTMLIAEIHSLLAGVMIPAVTPGKGKKPSTVTIPLKEGDAAWQLGHAITYAEALADGEGPAAQELKDLFKTVGSEGGKKILPVVFGDAIAKIDRKQLPFTTDGAKLLQLIIDAAKEHGPAGAEFIMMLGSAMSTLRYPIGFAVLEAGKAMKEAQDAKAIAQDAKEQAAAAMQAVEELARALEQLGGGGTPAAAPGEATQSVADSGEPEATAPDDESGDDAAVSAEVETPSLSSSAESDAVPGEAQPVEEGTLDSVQGDDTPLTLDEEPEVSDEPTTPVLRTSLPADLDLDGVPEGQDGDASAASSVIGLDLQEDEPRN